MRWRAGTSGARSPCVLLSRSTRPSKLRAEAPESREERSASSIKLSGRQEMMTINASRRTAGGMTSNNSASPPSLAVLIMASCSRSSCNSLTEAGPCRTPGAGPGPAQHEPAALVPASFQAERRRERDRLFQRLPLFGRGLGSRQPRIDQDGQVLLILLLEFLDHQLAATGRCSPVDPPRAVARAIIAQSMVFHLLRGTVVPLAAAVFRRLPLHLEPAPRQTADRGINHDLVGQADRDAMLDQSKRRAGAHIQIAKSILAAPGARGTPSESAHRSRPATLAKKTRGVTLTAPVIERSTGTSESSRKTARAPYQRRPFSRV